MKATLPCIGLPNNAAAKSFEECMLEKNCCAFCTGSDAPREWNRGAPVYVDELLGNNVNSFIVGWLVFLALFQPYVAESGKKRGSEDKRLSRKHILDSLLLNELI